MEMNQIETSAAQKKTIRVLCVLTWIGTAIALVVIALAVWVLNFRSVGPVGAQNDLASVIANITLLVHLIGAILCYFGAKQMWNFKRKGFYYFTIGVIVPDVVSGSVFGATFFSGASLVVFIVPILFIVLFGLKVKHMS